MFSNKSSYRTFYLAFLALGFFLCSCSSQKKIQKQGGYLLISSKTHIDNAYIPSDEVDGFIQQKPVKHFLFLRPGIGIYNWTEKKPTKFRKRVQDVFATKPVILDTIISRQSILNIRRYLANKGFHEPKISQSVEYRKHKALVTYNIIAGPPLTVRDLTFDIKDSLIAHYFETLKPKSLLKPQMIFDTYVLDNENDRITKELKNLGYYTFSKNEIFYQVDTTIGNHQVDMTLVLKEFEVKLPNSDSLVQVNYPQYFLRNIYIDLHGSAEANNSPKDKDTLVYQYKMYKKDTTLQTLYFISSDDLKFRPRTIAEKLSIASGQTYNRDLTSRVYKKIIQLPIVQSVTINYNMANLNELPLGKKQWLDCNINLAQNEVSEIMFDTEATTSGGSLGMGVNTGYRNANIFRGGEVFQIKLNLAAEAQGNFEATDIKKYLKVFNTLEASAGIGLDFPRLLVPFNILSIAQYGNPTTSINAGYSFEHRPDYERRVTSVAFPYQWSLNERMRHTFTPFELNFVSIEKDSAFEASLRSFSDPQIISQYTDHMLSMTRYSILISNKYNQSLNHNYFLRLAAETSGNFLYLGDKLFNTPLSDDGTYNKFGIPYSQYIRFDLDFRLLWMLGKERSLAWRLVSGIGIPYGNSQVLPFEKGFWLGGANDMRGWMLRSLGPGSYSSDTISYDRIGDLVIQSSAEYRFPIYQFFKGAFFVDAGNIWMRKEDVNFPGGAFHWNTFLNDIAIDSGFGLRLDFKFFIFRIDMAMRIKNPALDNQWFNEDDFKLRKMVWQLGIGLPF